MVCVVGREYVIGSEGVELRGVGYGWGWRVGVRMCDGRGVEWGGVGCRGE